ncbi:MAG: 30S ribosomal protein S19e, partial [Candidatus Woesearchaeota archaeon]
MHAISQQQLIEEVSKDLKQALDKPDWAEYVKTGVSRQRPPVRDDWWYVRAASILRTIYFRGPIGVSKLRTKYGGLKNRGVAPGKFFKGSGSVVRKILQQLEEAELIKPAERGVHKGRMVTSKGASLLFAASKRVSAAEKKAVKAEEKPVEKKAPAKKQEEPVEKK